jgi:hypothetical protein
VAGPTCAISARCLITTSPASSGKRSSAVALEDYQRSVVRRRRDEMWTLRLSSSRALRGPADRATSLNSRPCCSLRCPFLQHNTDPCRTSRRVRKVPTGDKKRVRELRTIFKYRIPSDIARPFRELGAPCNYFIKVFGDYWPIKPSGPCSFVSIA